ncbi:MAG: ABC transporter ATP-binding protein [Candidatus Heimdallarchaeota archaeon]|nr:ABC transporter ATP-binding protein [Candidatus Heimdallarchaeota archaeon]
MNTPPRPVVRLTNISKTYGFVQALKNINLDINQGEIVGLVGNNGAGKSTLLKIIALLVKPAEGIIELFNRQVDDEIHSFKKNLGILLNSPFFYEDLTGRENFHFFLRMKKQVKHPQKVVQDIIDQYGLKLFIDRPYYELSTGMMKKLEILRTISPDFPLLLLLDEPFSGLDTENKKFLSNLITNKGSKNTVILCSHDFNIVNNLCSKIVLLERGKIKKIFMPTEYNHLLAHFT